MVWAWGVCQLQYGGPSPHDDKFRHGHSPSYAKFWIPQVDGLPGIGGVQGSGIMMTFFVMRAACRAAWELALMWSPLVDEISSPEVKNRSTRVHSSRIFLFGLVPSIPKVETQNVAAN